MYVQAVKCAILFEGLQISHFASAVCDCTFELPYTNTVSYERLRQEHAYFIYCTIRRAHWTRVIPLELGVRWKTGVNMTWIYSPLWILHHIASISNGIFWDMGYISYSSCWDISGYFSLYQHARD